MNFHQEHLEILFLERTFLEYFNPKTPISPLQTAIFLYGFPRDEGNYNINERVGSEKGPYSFRKGLKENPYVSFENIDKIAIFDEGNAINCDNSLKESHKILQMKMGEFLMKISSLAFVIGGSNDMTYSNIKGLLATFPDKSMGIININAHLNVKEGKKEKFLANSTFRMIMEDKDFIASKSFIYHFAIQGVQNTEKDYQYIAENNGFIVFLNKNIRTYKRNGENRDVFTQAGQLFEEILSEISQKVENIVISFDLDAINSAYCPGVSSPSVIGGLTDMEAEEIIWLAGRNKKVRLVDMSEFNPAVEDTRTRKLVTYLFYLFCKGVANR